MTSTNNAPDQTWQAREAITLMLDLDVEAQDRLLARLIAATLHSGPSSALYRFAAEDVLERDDSLAELNRVWVPSGRESWVDALGRFILYCGGQS